MFEESYGRIYITPSLMHIYTLKDSASETRIQVGPPPLLLGIVANRLGTWAPKDGHRNKWAPNRYMYLKNKCQGKII
jgi:hypothetical protein